MLRRLALFHLVALWVLACGLEPALAGAPLNSQSNWRTAAFASGPTAVTVDVIDLSDGSQVGNNLATTQTQADSADTIIHKYDLSTVTGYPENCEPATYLVIFNPDATDCSESGSPTLCAYDYVQVGGSACLASTQPVSQTFVYTSSVVSGQGITQDVLDFYNRRGMLVPKWQKFETAGDLDFSGIDETAWLVFFYEDSGSAPRINCTVPTTTDPAGSLPSSSHCP
jgi:hypothetical protein